MQCKWLIYLMLAQERKNLCRICILLDISNKRVKWQTIWYYGWIRIKKEKIFVLRSLIYPSTTCTIRIREKTILFFRYGLLFRILIAHVVVGYINDLKTNIFSFFITIVKIVINSVKIPFVMYVKMMIIAM